MRLLGIFKINNACKNTKKFNSMTVLKHISETCLLFNKFKGSNNFNPHYTRNLDNFRINQHR